MTISKITAIGNSFGVILPKEMLARFHLQKGDTVHLNLSADGIQLMPYDAEFEEELALATEIMRRDRDVLRKLAE